MADVTLHKLVKRYDKTDIIKGVDIDIKDGEFTVFVGLIWLWKIHLATHDCGA
ncbi:hypothetical protein [Marinomonas rhodophyticola]|uniref:hypothetical protein n=1 Tax=Marinomonas rhodophyticola TaxID=2992803 RepID=UPI003D16C653